MPAEYPTSKRLNEAVILLVCGVPEPMEANAEISDEEVRSLEDQITRVEEAVISLSRAVFSAGGKLTFADDVLLTPLVAHIASEYWEPMPIEKSEPQEERRESGPERVIIYGRRKDLAETGVLVRPGYVRIQPEIPSEVTAVIAIGGTKTQSNQFGTWFNRREKIPFYVVASAGGWAQSLHEKSSVSDTSDDIRLWERIESARTEIRFPAREKQTDNKEQDEISKDEQVPEFRYSIYPLLMSNIVEEVARRLGR